LTIASVIEKQLQPLEERIRAMLLQTQSDVED